MEDTVQNQDSAQGEREWSGLGKILFRFLCLYLLLNTLPFPINYLPGGSVVEGWTQKLWQATVPAFGHTLLGIDQEIALRRSGSGDRLFNYVTVALHLFLAFFGSLVWTLRDHRRHYRTLRHWLVIGVRYYLGTFLLVYGIIKLFGGQFPFPGLATLLKAYGDSSPMHLVWTFMGYSLPYVVFAGAGETLGGLLLLFRRTATLGALVGAGVMSQVVMLNFAYDVPVKLFSSHLLLMAVGLLCLDRRRLLAVFWQHRAVAPRSLGRAFRGRRWSRLGLVAKTLFIGYFLFQNLQGGFQAYHSYGRGRDKPPLYGIWQVDSFVVDDEQRPPLTTDEERWRHLVVDWEGFAVAHLMNGSFEHLTFEVNPATCSIELSRRLPDSKPGTWAYRGLPEEPDGPSRLELSGQLDGSSYRLQVSARDADDFLLVSRGFHWVNEFPFNR